MNNFAVIYQPNGNNIFIRKDAIVAIMECGLKLELILTNETFHVSFNTDEEKQILINEILCTLNLPPTIPNNNA